MVKAAFRFEERGHRRIKRLQNVRHGGNLDDTQNVALGIAGPTRRSAAHSGGPTAPPRAARLLCRAAVMESAGDHDPSPAADRLRIAGGPGTTDRRDGDLALPADGG